VTTMDQVQARLPRMLIDLERLVRCESPSSDLAAVATSAALVAELGAQYLGQQPETIVVQGRSHLRWRIPGSAPRALLVGHHDTVWPIGSLQTHPWQVEDGPHGRVVRGPGCFDMKAGLVQLFHAVDLLAAKHSITILITGDEEIGSPTSRELIEAEARTAGAALILEPSADGGALKT
jgi:glutamate carboxypeptidase